MKSHILIQKSKIQSNQLIQKNIGMQTPSPDILKLTKDSNLFSITVQLSDCRLVLTLQDYDDWVIYEKQFTEQDIGKQIHRKLELIDVYSAFCEVEDKKQDKKDTITIEGDFERGIVGTINKKPKYRIQKEGKITTYTEVTFKRNGVQVQEIYQCKIKLEKKDQMKEMDVFMAKAQKQKRDIVNQFYKKLQDVERESAQLRQQMEQLKDQMRKMTKANQYNSEQLQKIIKSDNIKTQQIKQLQKTINDLLKNSKYIKLDSSSPFHTKFFTSENRITYVGQQSKFTQFIIKQQIPHDKKYKFKFKIVRSSGKNIMLGIIDARTQIQHRSSYNSSNAWALYGCGQGYKYPGSIVEGKGFQVGDLVEIQVSLKQQFIVWEINGKYNSSFKQQTKFNDGSGRIFQPYGELWQENQCVQWLGSETSDY